VAYIKYASSTFWIDRLKDLVGHTLRQKSEYEECTASFDGSPPSAVVPTLALKFCTALYPFARRSIRSAPAGLVRAQSFLFSEIACPATDGARANVPAAPISYWVESADRRRATEAEQRVVVGSRATSGSPNNGRAGAKQCRGSAKGQHRNGRPSPHYSPRGAHARRAICL
jgi:hypothetical protein